MASIEFNDSVLKTAYGPSLKAYYRFENGVTDSSGNGYDLTASGTPTYAAGMFGNAIDLEASSSQYADINQAALNITGSQSWGCWIKMESIADMYIMGLAQSGVGQRALYINVTTGKPTFLIDGLTTNSFVTWDSNLTTGVWYHVVGTYNSVTQKLALYVNGQSKSVAASGAGTALTSNFVVGRRHSFNDFYFDGLIDDAFFFNTALTAEDVKELYEGRMPGELWPNYSANLQGLWHLSGTTDSSANGYNLTNNGTTTFIPGKFGNGATFNGSSQYLNIAHASCPNLETIGDQSYSLWVKPTNFSTQRSAFGKTNATNGRSITIPTSGKVLFVSYKGGDDQFITSTGILVAGIWNHIFISYVSSGQVVSIFVNGEKTVGSFSRAMVANTDAFTIGRLGTLTEYYLGEIDEFAIFDRAWSDTEIKNYYAWSKGMRVGVV